MPSRRQPLSLPTASLLCESKQINEIQTVGYFLWISSKTRARNVTALCRPARPRSRSLSPLDSMRADKLRSRTPPCLYSPRSRQWNVTAMLALPHSEPQDSVSDQNRRNLGFSTKFPWLTKLGLPHQPRLMVCPPTPPAFAGTHVDAQCYTRAHF
jgi:hypothetical protein